MSGLITCDYQFNRVCKEYARMIWDDLVQEHETNNPDDLEEYFGDVVFEYVESAEHIIYTNRAIAICYNCNTNDGEDWLEEIYGHTFDGCSTFAEVCSRLAFAETYCRTLEFLKEVAEEKRVEIEEEEGE